MDIIIIKEPISRAELKIIAEKRFAVDRKFLHGDSIEERWRRMTFAEQMGNIGSEVSRAGLSQGKNDTRFNNAVARALELFDLTLSDPRWRGRLLEIGRAREVFCDAVLGGKEYDSDFSSLQSYFDQFAMIAMTDFNKKYGF